MRLRTRVFALAIGTRRAKLALVRNVRNQNDLTDFERGRSSTGEDRSLPIQTTALEHPGSKGDADYANSADSADCAW